MASLWTTGTEQKPMDTGTGTGAGEGVAAGHALEPIAASDLVEFAETEAAKRLERLEADRELVLQLALRGYEGPAWQQFASALAEYGFQVVAAWTKSGLIFAKCTEKGLGLATFQAISRSSDDAEEIAGETVAIAIRAFRDKVLVPARWDPSRGATLRTFFIGQCIFQFPNVLRRWVAEQALPSVDTSVLAAQLERTTHPSPDVLVELSRSLKVLETLPNEHPAKIKTLAAMGYSHVEIAELLDCTEKAVEMKLYHARKARGAQ
jgi:DNA-directed RNA polymerase specialized sigma24 family protein